MKLQNSKLRELSVEEKIATEGGYMIPVSWIAAAAVAVSDFVEDAKTAIKTLTNQ